MKRDIDNMPIYSVNEVKRWEVRKQGNKLAVTIQRND